ncbi:MAG: hypothetical protein FWD03_10150, partial [Defluviitaleaceae bacterium]|nr:hypothetical protein [Defluviitaleaceae bacterium]
WAYLEGLSTTLSIDSIPGGALLYHGSPDKPDGTVLTQEAAAHAAAKHKEKWLLGGHVHRVRLFRVGQQRVAAVGSVGLSLDKIGGVACYALLDGDKIVFRHVMYDLDAAVEAFKQSGYPEAVPYFSKAMAGIMVTGIGYFGVLDNFVYEYVERQLGHSPEKISDEMWLEAAPLWKVEDWLEEIIG